MEHLNINEENINSQTGNKEKKIGLNKFGQDRKTKVNVKERNNLCLQNSCYKRTSTYHINNNTPISKLNSKSFGKCNRYSAGRTSTQRIYSVGLSNSSKKQAKSGYDINRNRWLTPCNNRVNNNYSNKNKTNTNKLEKNISLSALKPNAERNISSLQRRLSIQFLNNSKRYISNEKIDDPEKESPILQTESENSSVTKDNCDENKKECKRTINYNEGNNTPPKQRECQFNENSILKPIPLPNFNKNDEKIKNEINFFHSPENKFSDYAKMDVILFKRLIQIQKELVENENKKLSILAKVFLPPDNEDDET
ncbi:uncharacterized protein [Rhodnius prolixus]|uniref:uncharacterized protein n=1 Tax=Rhodnius prolixus TaxID=13249 RepID=UPI003D18B707